MRPIFLVVLLIGIAPLWAAEDAAEKQREVTKLLTHLGYDDSLPRMLASIHRTMRATYAGLNLSPEIWDEIARELSHEEARAMSARLYSEKLSLEEIRAANAFYESEVGRSYAKKVAEIGEQEFYEAREWSKRKVEAVLKRHTTKGR